MAKMALKNYKMALGTCGPEIIYTDIIKAYSPEEAARKYLLSGYTEDAVTEEKIAELAKAFHEVPPKTALEVYYDCCGEKMDKGDQVYAVINMAFVEGIITKLSSRSVKVAYGDKEHNITINSNDKKTINGIEMPYFSKLLKRVSTTDEMQDITTGSYVAFIKTSFNSFDGIGFGEVTRVTSSYVYINGEAGEVRKTLNKVMRIR